MFNIQSTSLIPSVTKFALVVNLARRFF